MIYTDEPARILVRRVAEVAPVEGEVTAYLSGFVGVKYADGTGFARWTPELGWVEYYG